MCCQFGNNFFDVLAGRPGLSRKYFNCINVWYLGDRDRYCRLNISLDEYVDAVIFYLCNCEYYPCEFQLN